VAFGTHDLFSRHSFLKGTRAIGRVHPQFEYLFTLITNTLGPHGIAHIVLLTRPTVAESSSTARKTWIPAWRRPADSGTSRRPRGVWTESHENSLRS